MKSRYALSIAILGFSLLPLTSVSASASIGAMTQPAIAADESMIIQVQRRGGRGGGHVNRNVNVNRNLNRNLNRNVNVNRNLNRNVNRNFNRNVNVNRNVRVNRGYYGGRHVYRGGYWSRPRNYWWPVGGAIAAGAAIGMITAASAASLAGPAPGPGYCWYYTDPSQTQGFWDQCP